jgi:deoxyribodipyrimidine photo-lyase
VGTWCSARAYAAAVAEHAAAGDVAVVWFRRDLRLDDNPAWAAATAQHRRVVALFVYDQRLLDAAGPFRRRQLLAEVAALDADLRQRAGAGLTLRAGDPASVVPTVVREAGAGDLYLNTDVSPFATARDAAVGEAAGVRVHGSYGTLVHRPGVVLTKAGTLSKVFTPFWKTWEATAWDRWPTPGTADVVALDGISPVAADADPPCAPGAAAARARLEAFAAGPVDNYADARDQPGVAGTSVLSPDLKFGTLSPRAALTVVGQSSVGRAAWCRQMAWRDWYAHLLAEYPSLVHAPMNDKYANAPWRNDPEGFAAWQAGATGYPLVDAGMRQLAATGWMHNRVRMVAASFLVKDLLVDWRLGERHFRRLLVDGDTPQNVGNWQWSAGTGPDAAPYHRVMNPVLQSRRFDPEGRYLRTWVPELAALSDAAIHAPWEVPPLELAGAGVELGSTYPFPLVDHAAARDRYLAVMGPKR